MIEKVIHEIFNNDKIDKFCQDIVFLFIALMSVKVIYFIFREVL